MKHAFHRCSKHGRVLCLWCVTQSAIFPVEHYVWEKLWPLNLVTKALGL